MKKLNNKKGFTLAELLVVVAIIAVLVAISIPIFTSQLEKAREATDLANMRAAKAAAVTAYLSDDATLGVGSTQTGDVTVYYDAPSGKLISKTPTSKYGKGTATVGSADNTTTDYDPAKAALDYITVVIGKDGTVTETFQAK